MANKKCCKRIIISDSENSSDVDFHQSHPPKKRSRLPNYQTEGGLKNGITPIDPELITSFPSCSNDFFSSTDVIVISDDDEYSSGEKISSRESLRTSDIEDYDTPEQCGPPHTDSDDDDCIIIEPSSPVTDTESSGCLERSTSEEQ
ncbi:uncharacterized protein LOC143773431 [Ranitomeya variabilis]|uniref:uncharacterized protein LOC143773431 n=1 Tax=Ranitomeya variabilis TaxID=490064 RepID=UPI0040565F52